MELVGVFYILIIVMITLIYTFVRRDVKSDTIKRGGKQKLKIEDYILFGYISKLSDL